MRVATIAININVLFPDDNVILSFAGGFAVRVKAMNGFLSVRIEVPSSLQDDPEDSGKLEGLFGNFNDDPSDDLTDWVGNEHSISTLTDDQLYSYQDSCESLEANIQRKDNKYTHEPFRGSLFYESIYSNCVCTLTKKSFRSEKLSEKNGFRYSWVLYPFFLEGILLDR